MPPTSPAPMTDGGEPAAAVAPPAHDDGHPGGGRPDGRLDLALELLRALASRVEPLADDAQRRARLFDDLHDEMRRYREDFLFRAQQPLLLDLIALHDALDRLARAHAGDERVRADLAALRDQLLETLYRHDVEPIDARPAKLDVAIQKAVRRVETTDPACDRDVVEYLQEGFVRRAPAGGHVVLRPQMIVVARLAPVADAARNGARSGAASARADG